MPMKVLVLPSLRAPVCRASQPLPPITFCRRNQRVVRSFAPFPRSHFLVVDLLMDICSNLKYIY
jgi:hypothetical protein